MCNYSCNLPKVFIPMFVASLTGTKVSLHYSTQYITYLCSVPLPYHFGTSMQYNLIMEKNGETKAWLRLFSHLPPCSPVTNPGPACVACSLTLKDSGLAALCLMVLVFCLLCLLLLLLVVVFLLVLLFNSDLMQPVASLVWQCQQKIPPKHMKWTCDLDIFRGCFAVGMVSAFGASYVSSKAMTTINRFSHDAWCLCAGPVGTIALARCRRSSSERPWAFSSVSEPFARPTLLADAGDKCWSFWIQLIWKKNLLKQDICVLRIYKYRNTFRKYRNCLQFIPISLIWDISLGTRDKLSAVTRLKASEAAQGVKGYLCLEITLRIEWPSAQKPQMIPSRELTYPTLGKGNSSSNLSWRGIC